MKLQRLVYVVLTFAPLVLWAAPSSGPALPKVRTITGFVSLDRSGYVTQVEEALAVLKEARAQLRAQGYEVETLRLVTQPLGELVSGLSEEQARAFLADFARLSARDDFVPNVGPAMLGDGDNPATLRLLGRALLSSPRLNGSARIAAADGIHWNVIRESAALVRFLAQNSPGSQANFNFTATAMVEPYGPFYPGAYHLGPGRRFSIGFESANVVKDVFARTHGNFDGAVAELTRQLTRHARVAETVGLRVAAAKGWVFAGVDPTPAPLGVVSIGAAIEAYTGSPFGSSGTLTAALAITTAVKAVPVKQAGFSGLMIPVMEDETIARRWGEGRLTTDMLLAYSAVCGTGLDTVPYPGDISEEQLRRILGDVASLAWKWHKPLAARLQPVQGRKAGERTTFDNPLLFNTTLRPVP